MNVPIQSCIRESSPVRLRPGGIIVSGVSGGGKSTLADTLKDRQSISNLVFSVSVTTRKPRSNEIDGVHYHFWEPSRFVREVSHEGFLEFEEVHDEYYGTLKGAVNDQRSRGNCVFMDIDVKGHASVRKNGDFDDNLVSIFLMPPSLEEMERRLRTRKDLSPKQIATRMRNAPGEIARSGEYDHVLINETGRFEDLFLQFLLVVNLKMSVT